MPGEIPVKFGKYLLRLKMSLPTEGPQLSFDFQIHAVEVTQNKLQTLYVCTNVGFKMVWTR